MTYYWRKWTREIEPSARPSRTSPHSCPACTSCPDNKRHNPGERPDIASADNHREHVQTDNVNSARRPIQGEDMTTVTNVVALITGPLAVAEPSEIPQPRSTKLKPRYIVVRCNRTGSAPQRPSLANNSQAGGEEVSCSSHTEQRGH